MGYPHELITRALNLSEIVLKGKYRVKTKLLANFLKFVLAKKHSKISVEKTDDISLKFLASLIEQSDSTLKTYSALFRKELDLSLIEFETSQSKTAYDQSISLLKKGIFLHILSKESRKQELIVNDIIQKFSEIIEFDEKELKTIFSGIQLLADKNCEFIPYNLVFEFSRFDEKTLFEVAIFLTYSLATKCIESKRELLIAHYILVKEAIKEFNSVRSQENLTDQILVPLFKLAIVLVYCGYYTSLRIPNGEKILYAKTVLKLPSIEYSFKKYFDNSSSIKIPQIDVRIPLWLLLAINSALLILHLVYEIYLPLDLSQLGFQVILPSVPTFLTTAIFISVFTFFRLLHLKQKIIKKFRRGELDKES